MPKSKVTIRDIAQMAGVSRGTVDRVLNNRGRVDLATKANILQIADELGYKKNMVARNLALNQEWTIHIIIPQHQEDHFWTMVYDGISATDGMLQQFNLSLHFFQFNLHSVEDYLEKLEQACTAPSDFVLIAPVFTQETLSFLKTLPKDRARFLAINSEFGENSEMIYVGQDSFKAGQIAGNLFHNSIPSIQKQILCLTLGHDSSNAIHIQRKMEGLQAFDREYKAGFDLIPVTIEAFRNEADLKASCQAIEAQHPSVEGIFFTNSRAKPFIDASGYFKSRSKAPKVIGFDLVRENINLLKDGLIDYLLDEQPYAQGKLGMSMIFDHLIYGKALQSTRYLPINIVIRENIDDYLSLNALLQD